MTQGYSYNGEAASGWSVIFCRKRAGCKKELELKTAEELNLHGKKLLLPFLVFSLNLKITIRN